MHIDALDSYRPGESPVHRLDPRVKLILTFLFILVAALTPDVEAQRPVSLLAFGLLGGLILLAELLSRIGLGLIQKRSLVALPFTLAALTVVFSTPGRALWTAHLPGGPWAITDAGLFRFLSILLRSYLSIQAAVLLTATTPFPHLLWGMRALRVPRTLVAISGFLYRYLFVLADEAARMMRARETRSVALESRREGQRRGDLPAAGRQVCRPCWLARVTGAMAGSLFIRSYERSERIYAAMVARGYDGEIRTLSPPSLRPADLAAGAAAILALLSILFVGGGG